MKYIIGLIFIGLISVGSHADCSGASCTDVTIDQIYLKASGTYLIQTSGNESALTSTCAAYGGKYLQLPEGESKKDLLSILLTAQVSGKNTTVYVTNNGSLCEILAIQLNR